MASEPAGQQQTWSSQYASYRRSVESSRCHSTLLSLTLRRRLIWLTEAVYSGFCKRLAAHHNYWLWSPHFMLTCAARFVSTAQHLSPSSSVAESKQGCVLASTLFGIFFSMLLQYAFKDCHKGVYIHTRTGGKLFNIARLRAKTKVTEVLIREMLFADDAALTSHTVDGLQQLVSRFSYACKEFGLTISLEKNNIMAQEKGSPPTVAIDGYNLKVVENFTYLGSTISSSLSIDVEINSKIAKAVAVMARLNQRVWSNNNLTVKTKLCVYKACVLSTLLYSSETWTTHVRHEKKLNSFHLRCLRRILCIQWQDKVPNTEVLECTGMSEKRLRWLGHVRRMGPGRIPRELLYGELAEGSRLIGRPRLRYKDICKKDMKLSDINIDTWESRAEDRSAWHFVVRQGVQKAEETRIKNLATKRVKRKEKQLQPQLASSSSFICRKCSRDCHSSIGLYSHSRRCR